MNHWDGLTRFLADGRIELDNNTVERGIRPIVLNRKNALFAGHDVGASYCSSDDALIKEEDFAAGPKISGVVIAWRQLRGTQRLLQVGTPDNQGAPPHSCLAGRAPLLTIR